MLYRINKKGINRVVTSKINEKYAEVIGARLKLSVPVALGAKYKKTDLEFYRSDSFGLLVEFKIHESVDSISAIEVIIKIAEELLENYKK